MRKDPYLRLSESIFNPSRSSLLCLYQSFRELNPARYQSLKTMGGRWKLDRVLGLCKSAPQLERNWAKNLLFLSHQSKPVLENMAGRRAVLKDVSWNQGLSLHRRISRWEIRAEGGDFSTAFFAERISPPCNALARAGIGTTPIFKWKEIEDRWISVWPAATT
jgi:hypothetical protein